MLGDIFSWMKSTRSIAVVIVIIALSVGLFSGKVSAESYITVAMVIIGSYFAKRDETKKEDDEPQP